MILSILGMSTDVASIVLPIITSLFVFFSGSISRTYYNHRIKKKQIEESREIVIQWADMVIKAVKEQIKAIDSLANEIRQSEELLPKAFHYMKNMAERLGDMTADRMESIFLINCKVSRRVEDKRRQNAYNIISQYVYLSLMEDEIQKAYGRYNDACRSAVNEWNALLKKTQQDVEVLSKSDRLKNIVVRDILCSTVSHYLMNHNQNNSFETVYSGLIQPLEKAVMKCKSEFPEISCGNAVYCDSQEMSLMYQKWRANNNGYSEMFSEMSQSLHKSIESLKQATTYFEENTKVKVRYW